MVNKVKITLIVLLLLCLADMPYFYYQIVKFIGMLGFGFLAYTEKDNEDKFFFFLWLISAILISPVLKLNLGRVLWNLVDVLLAITLLYSVYIQNNNQK